MIFTRADVLERLHDCAENGATIEDAHREADRLLIMYIDDPDIAAAYRAIEKWYC